MRLSQRVANQDNVNKDVLKSLETTLKDRSADMKHRMIAYLEYVAIVYQLEQRALYSNGRGRTSCQYAPTIVSRGCAIGRFLPFGLAAKIDSELTFDDNMFDSSISNVIENGYELPDWMQDFDVDYLADLQLIHDSDSNWNVHDERANEITERGYERLDVTEGFILGGVYD